MTDLLLSLLRGVPTTLAVTFGAFLAGAVVGVPLVLMRRSRSLGLAFRRGLDLDRPDAPPPLSNSYSEQPPPPARRRLWPDRPATKR